MSAVTQSWRGQAQTVEQTHAVAAWLARVARVQQSRMLIGLSGDLGAGKTTFVQGFVKALSPERDLYVTSPTFAIVQSYDCSPPVTHMDLYRLGSIEELEAIGYREQYFDARPGVTLVEWIELVPEAIPDEWIDIRLVVDPTDVRDMREIRVRAQGASTVAGLAAVSAPDFLEKVTDDHQA